MKIPPRFRCGIYAAYSAESSLVLGERTLGRPWLLSSDMSGAARERAIPDQQVLGEQPRVERMLRERARLGKRAQVTGQLRSSGTTRGFSDIPLIFRMIPDRTAQPGGEQIVAPALQPSDQVHGRYALGALGELERVDLRIAQARDQPLARLGQPRQLERCERRAACRGKERLGVGHALLFQPRERRLARGGRQLEGDATAAHG